MSDSSRGVSDAPGLELGTAVTRGLIEASASYAYLDTEDESTGQELLGRAAHTARGAVTLVRRSASVRTEVIYTGRVPLSRSSGVTRYQEGYARLNLSLTAGPVAGLTSTSAWTMPATLAPAER